MDIYYSEISQTILVMDLIEPKMTKHTFSVTLSTTVLGLKAEIAIQLGYPTSDQTLTYKGLRMIDDHRLSYYYITSSHYVLLSKNPKDVTTLPPKRLACPKPVLPTPVEEFEQHLKAAKEISEKYPISIQQKSEMVLSYLPIHVDQVAEKLDNLELENSKSIEMDDQKYCVICMEQERRVVLLPCLHRHFCVECAKNISNCSTCREPILNRITIFN